MGLARGSVNPDQLVELGAVAAARENHRFELQPSKSGPDTAWAAGARLGFSTFADREEMWSEGWCTSYDLALRTADHQALGEDCHLEWSGTSHAANRSVFTGSRPVADGLVYPFFTLRVPITRAGNVVCESSTLDDRRLMDSRVLGTTGDREPLLPRCFRNDGETLSATGAPGCPGD